LTLSSLYEHIGGGYEYRLVPFTRKAVAW